MRKRKIMLLVLAFLLFVLNGCGKAQKEQEQEPSDTGAYNVVDVKKDGSVINTIE